MVVSLFDRSFSLPRGLRRKSTSKRNRRVEERRLRLAIDQLESRRALAITTPLSIGGVTVASFLDAPTGPGNLGDFVTVSIEGTKGTVIFNQGTTGTVPDDTDIQTIDIIDASPDFQLTFNGLIRTANPVPYGSDGIVQLGTITTTNVIRGINTVRGPATNVALSSPPNGFTQTSAGSTSVTLAGDQSATFNTDVFVAATPLVPSAGTPVFSKVSSWVYDSGADTTTVVLGAATGGSTTAGALTTAETRNVEFQLTKFSGVNFSNVSGNGGSGLMVDTVLGDGLEGDVGIVLSQGLRANASIMIRKQLDATMLIGASPNAAVNGRVFIESSTAASAIFIGPKNTPNWANSMVQLIGGEGEFGADVFFAQPFNGVMNLGGLTAGTTLFTRGVGQQARLNAGSWSEVLVQGDFAGTINSTSDGVRLSVSRNLTGTARVNSDSNVTLAVGGTIQRGAVVSADSGVTFAVGGNLLGTIQAGSSVMTGAVGRNVNGAKLAGSNNITLTVGGNIVNSTLAADDEFTLNVNGNVTNSNLTSGDTEISFAIAGNVVNSRFVGALDGAIGGSVSKSSFFAKSDSLEDLDPDITLDVTGSMSQTVVDATSDVSVTVGGNVTQSQFISTTSDVVVDVGGDIKDSTLIAADEFTLNVNGNVTNSNLTSGDTEISFAIAGNVVNSRFVGALDGAIGGSVSKSSFFAKSDSLEDLDPDITLDVTGSMSQTVVDATSDVSVTVGGNVTQSQFISTTSDVVVDVGGDIKDSTLIAADDGVTLTVGRDALNVKVVGDDAAHSLAIARNFSGTVQNGSGDVTFDVGGSVLKGSSITTGGNAAVDVTGNFDGSVTSSDLRFFVNGNVSTASRIVAQRVTDWQGANNANFEIGGRLDGIVNVGVFDAAPNFAAVTILGNGAGKNARFNVGRFETDAITVQGNFNGNLRVLQDLTANLQFNGNVNFITIGGRVGSYDTGNAGLPIPVSINVTGQLKYLNSNSYFQAAVPGKSGTFYNDSLGTQSTGLLTTGSYLKVVPTLPAPVTPPAPTPPQTYTAPTAPQNFSASLTTGPDGIQVSFDAPSSNGGLPVVYYEYSTNATAGTPVWRRFDTPSQGPGTNIALTVDSSGGAWIPGNTYQVAVRAVNAIGATATGEQPVTLPT